MQVFYFHSAVSDCLASISNPMFNPPIIPACLLFPILCMPDCVSSFSFMYLHRHSPRRVVLIEAQWGQRRMAVIWFTARPSAVVSRLLTAQRTSNQWA